jgi:hypothetical protein
MKNFVDDLGITGYLTIIKRYKDGQEEVVFDDHNIIVSGMGVSLTYMFTGSGSNSVLDYQIDRFQLGVSGPYAGGTTSAIYELSGPLGDTYYAGAPNDYGAGSNLFIEKTTQIANSVDVLDQYFALIPANKITRIGDSSVRYTLVVDEEACNSLSNDDGDLSLNEVGMFVKNPTGNAINKPILVCYRNFSNVVKTSDFSLIFRWTLNF